MKKEVLLFNCQFCGKEYWVDSDYYSSQSTASTMWRRELELLHKKCSPDYKGELFFKCRFCGEEIYADPLYLERHPEAASIWYKQLEKEHLICNPALCSGYCENCINYADDGFCELVR